MLAIAQAGISKAFDAVEEVEETRRRKRAKLEEGVCDKCKGTGVTGEAAGPGTPD